MERPVGVKLEIRFNARRFGDQQYGNGQMPINHSEKTKSNLSASQSTKSTFSFNLYWGIKRKIG